MSPLIVAWLILIASILFEVFGMMFIRYSNGFSSLPPSFGGVCCFITSIWLMSISLKQIEMGIAYAVWAAVSTAIVAIIGVAFYAESASSFKITGLTLIVIGVVMLNLTSQ